MVGLEGRRRLEVETEVVLAMALTGNSPSLYLRVVARAALPGKRTDSVSTDNRAKRSGGQGMDFLFLSANKQCVSLGKTNYSVQPQHQGGGLSTPQPTLPLPVPPQQEIGVARREICA